MCITKTQEYNTLCLNKVVLHNVLVGLHRLRGDHLEQTVTNRSFCFASYRQFTWWVHQNLGKNNRRVIPSCAIWKIREKFPESDGTYIRYKEGEKD